ncbi:hypothetical protein EW146_g7097 [Bondarzewia mesenterica]|uniref:TERF2-interacting telomeric protein 1 Myb domain-containing protein n=1 Tax=Bondarzewia mesenterica TaxID=1095465 RepID=A0A4S4LNN9_9AGAM|nr:hypothetical protein EW146_g7097 [Bondarzewia mesenterica]
MSAPAVQVGTGIHRLLRYVLLYVNALANIRIKQPVYRLQTNMQDSFLPDLTVSRTMSKTRKEYTEDDDAYLAKYIASYSREFKGRMGNSLYMHLVENADGKWPWASKHSWQSWRERYKKNQVRIDRRINEYQRKHNIVDERVIQARLNGNGKRTRVPDEDQHGESTDRKRARIEDDDTVYDDDSSGVEEVHEATPNRRGAKRQEFTDQDDRLLIQYIAKNSSSEIGRSGNKLYQILTMNENGDWPWASRHPFASWRDRYIGNKAQFEANIQAYQQKHNIVSQRIILPSSSSKRGQNSRRHSASQDSVTGKQMHRKLTKKRADLNHDGTPRSTREANEEVETASVPGRRGQRGLNGGRTDAGGTATSHGGKGKGKAREASRTEANIEPDLIPSKVKPSDRELAPRENVVDETVNTVPERSSSISPDHRPVASEPLYPSLSSLPNPGLTTGEEDMRPTEPVVPGAFPSVTTPVAKPSRNATPSPTAQSKSTQPKFHVSQEPTPPRSGASAVSYVQSPFPPGGGHSDNTAVADNGAVEEGHLEPMDTVTTLDLSEFDGSLSPAKHSVAPGHVSERRRGVAPEEDNIFESVSPASPRTSTPPHQKRLVSTTPRKAREPPKIVEGPYVSALTSGRGTSRLSLSGRRQSGVEGDADEAEAWPPKRSAEKRKSPQTKDISRSEKGPLRFPKVAQVPPLTPALHAPSQSPPSLPSRRSTRLVLPSQLPRAPHTDGFLSSPVKSPSEKPPQTTAIKAPTQATTAYFSRRLDQHNAVASSSKVQLPSNAPTAVFKVPPLPHARAIRTRDEVHSSNRKEKIVDHTGDVHARRRTIATSGFLEDVPHIDLITATAHIQSEGIRRRQSLPDADLRTTYTTTPTVSPHHLSRRPSIAPSDSFTAPRHALLPRQSSSTSLSDSSNSGILDELPDSERRMLMLSSLDFYVQSIAENHGLHEKVVREVLEREGSLQKTDWTCRRMHLASRRAYEETHPEVLSADEEEEEEEEERRRRGRGGWMVGKRMRRRRVVRDAGSESEEEGEGGEESRATTEVLASSVPIGGPEMDAEWAAFQRTVLAAEESTTEDQKREAYARATVFAEPELAMEAEGMPVREGEGGVEETEGKAVVETEVDRRRRREQEERELIMDRMVEEERAQEEADSRVSLLKGRLDMLKKQRELARARKLGRT